ncbi:hypothetical protein SAMN06298216_0532 [Spirosomataceae bacterium TFI 002]|nr:hypothetical protein SAMN06298216_0532 [Spirosomataceae bacterium TFI 002]
MQYSLDLIFKLVWQLLTLMLLPNIHSMIDYKDHKYLDLILIFLKQIGIPFRLEKIKSEQFLPGILISNGSLIIDVDQLLFPGDIMHEAGHIALAPPEIRNSLNNQIDKQLDFDMATHELMAVLWSYAAAVEAKIPPIVVFHPEAYKGESEFLIQSFEQGNYNGLPMLQWLGMTYDEQKAIANNTKPFPHMISWLRPLKK